MNMKQNKNNTLFPWLLVLYEIAIYLSMDAYAPGLPKISRAFNASSNMTQLTMIMWMLGGFSLQAVFGPLSDRYGRRPILLLGGILYIISSIFCAISPNIIGLIISRFFQGITLPSMFITGYAVINEIYESEEAIKILARMNGITILAPAFGPILGGAFLLLFSWRWIFAILAIWSLIVVSLLYFKMPETVSTQAKQKPFSLIEILKHYKGIIKNIKFMAFSLMTFLPIIGLITWMLAGPFIIVHTFHYNSLDYGIIQLIIFTCFIIGTKLVGRFANKDRNRLLINLGLSFCVLGGLLATISSWILPTALFVFILFIKFFYKEYFPQPVFSYHF